MLQDDHIETLMLITSIKAFSKQGHIRSCRGYDMDISLGTHHSTHLHCTCKNTFCYKNEGRVLFPSLPSKNRAGKKANIWSLLPKAGQEIARPCSLPSPGKINESFSPALLSASL